MNLPGDVKFFPQPKPRNDPEMVALLLWFGADPLHYDSGSRNAYDCATLEVKAVFEQMNAAPHSARLCGKTKLERIPPPRGFERFFEELEKDPLVRGNKSKGK
eukprot:s472_g9.t1